MQLLRTPDGRFDDLHGYAFEPSYTEVGGGIRVHHVDDRLVPGVEGQPYRTISGAGPFPQENVPAELSQAPVERIS